LDSLKRKRSATRTEFLLRRKRSETMILMLKGSRSGKRMGIHYLMRMGMLMVFLRTLKHWGSRKLKHSAKRSGSGKSRRSGKRILTH
jgi:hypothetical protein